jgi:formimidoylglutamate deiminase
VGRRADWLVLDPNHPSMAGGSQDGALDHMLFSGGDAAIRHCMVAGRWVIKEGHHAAEEESRAAFGGLMRKFAGAA